LPVVAAAHTVFYSQHQSKEPYTALSGNVTVLYDHLYHPYRFAR